MQNGRQQQAKTALFTLHLHDRYQHGDGDKNRTNECSKDGDGEKRSSDKSIIQPDLLLVEGVVVSCDISIAPYAYAEMEGARRLSRRASGLTEGRLRIGFVQAEKAGGRDGNARKKHAHMSQLQKPCVGFRFQRFGAGRCGINGV
ncbi:hypothetical protein HED49_15375 [Ochrobactrum daejeonense]|nr:hypothetical protein [Brucella daejeonensis]